MTSIGGRPAPLQPFRWPVRVYYEDTDAAGIVYYASYLRFLERARTEWLAATGISVTDLASEHKAVFVVHRLEIDYRAPARLYDALEVTLRPIERGARLVVAQNIHREHDLVANARVGLAYMNPASGRPTRIPAPVLLALESSA